MAGKRVGPAEVESAATSHAAVLAAAAIGVPHPVKGEVIVVFCVLERGVTDDPDLRAAVAGHIAADMGKALKPDTVVVVAELPRTRSGKVMRRVIRGAWLGGETGDLSALENPLAVEAIRAPAPGPRLRVPRHPGARGSIEVMPRPLVPGSAPGSLHACRMTQAVAS